MGIQVPIEVRSLGAGVAGCCKLPDVRAETQTQILCNAACAFNLSPSLSSSDF